MLDIKFIRNNPDLVDYAIKQKKLEDSVDLSRVLELDSLYRDKLQQVETKRALRNALSEDISRIKDPKDREKLIEEARSVKEDLVDLEGELNSLEEGLENLLLQLPNIIHPEVPEGFDEEDNVVIRKWGTPREFDFSPKDHEELGRDLDIIDTDTSAVVSGARFNYLKNEAVLLQFALVDFVFKTLTDASIISQLAEDVGNPSSAAFTPVVPPVFVRADVAKKMDRLDPIEDRYYYEKDEMMLVGSAEHTLGPMYMDHVFDAEDLPVRLVGYSTAFRREAGSYGKDTQGILRRHQFDKLEMECFSTVENGLAEQDLLIAIQEYLLQRLEIPYQVVAISTGDMGKPDYRQIDIECWMPGQDTYRETNTSDYMADFQSRRLNTRYKDPEGDVHYVHMNDATAFAIGRTLIAIIENNQQKDGSVVVPSVLRSYMGGVEKITSRV
jgi:seryl-tRNA synthetase